MPWKPLKSMELLGSAREGTFRESVGRERSQVHSENTAKLPKTVPVLKEDN